MAFNLAGCFVTLLTVLSAAPVFAEIEDNEESGETEKALRIVPLITSSPLLGLGIGVTTSYLYNTKDEDSSKSQLQLGGQYSNTDSLSLFAKNNAFFKNNSIVSTTVLTYTSVNNEFSSDAEDVEYNVETVLADQIVIFKLAQDVFVGGQIIYKDIRHDPNNQEGEDFLIDNGIVDEKSLGFGVVASYDTRKNKYFPSDAAWLTSKLNTNPSALGAIDSYSSLTIDARFYAPGCTHNAVWASQIFGKYSTDKTPDTGLPTLSGKSLLRGFPAGQFKARYLTGAQSEYRYSIEDTRFRVTGFFGVANLSGGSIGTDSGSRHDDGWYYAGGIGLRYTIQQQTGVDVRLDIVSTSENVQSLYLMLNQAF